MKYFKSQMKQLIKSNKELQLRLRELMDEHGLEKNFAMKALYHSEVADGGKYQSLYQALDAPKDN
jgi:cyanate lyase